MVLLGALNCRNFKRESIQLEFYMRGFACLWSAKSLNKAQFRIERHRSQKIA